MDTDRVEPHELPGCGMAAYAGLLVVFGILGLVGMGSATMTMMQAAEEAGPARLMPGTQVAVWQMKPMRDAKIVGLTEVPLAWHDESRMRDGTAACALMDDRLIKVEDGQGATMAYADIDAVDVQDNNVEGHVVTARGTLSDGQAGDIVCNFAMNEGGPSMGRQLEAERVRAGGAPKADAAPKAEAAPEVQAGPEPAPSAPEGEQGGG